MPIDIGNLTSIIRLNPGQELKTVKPASDLYVGQILKTVVVKALDDNQVLININGQNINAKTSHHFSPGEQLQVQVKTIQDEIVLQIMKEVPQQKILQSALMKTLPQQAPATEILTMLSRLQHQEKLPENLQRQIQQLFLQIPSLEKLPAQLKEALKYSGLFLERNLLQGQSRHQLSKDFKALLFQMLASTRPSGEREQKIMLPGNFHAPPIAGARPQPLPVPMLPPFEHLTKEQLLEVLNQQLQHVVARVTSQQIHHLQQQEASVLQFMFDLPVKTEQGIEVIPFQIEKEPASATQTERWSLGFAVNLSELGGIQGRLSLAGRQLDIQLNVEKQASIDLLNEHQSAIIERLEEIGLECKNWTIKQGIEAGSNPDGFRLLDIRI